MKTIIQVSLLHSKPTLLQRPIDMLEQMQIATTVFPLFGLCDLEVWVVIAVVLRELSGVVQVEILVGNVFHFEGFSEDFLEAATKDAPFREFVPDCQYEHYDGEVEGKTVLIVWVDEFIDEGLRVVVLFDRNEHYQKVEERHEERVELELSHDLFGEAAIEFMLTHKPPQEQPLINPIQYHQSQQRKLQSNGYDGRHRRTNQYRFIDIRISQCQIYGMPLIKVIGLALRGRQLLGNSPPPIQPPSPHNIEIAHHATHIRIRNEQEEEIIDESQEVEREVRIRTFAIRYDPEGHEIGEVGGCEHIYHEDVGELVAHCGEVVRHGSECTVFAGEMADHYTQEGVETAADDGTGGGHADEKELVDGCGLLHFYEFFQQGQDEEIADQGEDKEQHMSFGHFTGVLVLGVGEILVDEVGWVVAFLYCVLFAILTHKLPCFDTIERNNTLSPEHQIG